MAQTTHLSRVRHAGDGTAVDHSRTCPEKMTGTRHAMTGGMFKYWLIAGMFDDDRIVIEWRAPDGTVKRSEGLRCERRDYSTVEWLYDSPPDAIDELVEKVFVDRGEYGVDGAELEGYLKRDEVDDFVCALDREAA